MGSFLEVFGEITIYQLSLLIMAVGFFIEKAKFMYIRITQHHDGKQDSEAQLKWLSQTVKQQTKDIELLKCGNLATLYYHLIAECDRVLENNEVTINELDRKSTRLNSSHH